MLRSFDGGLVNRYTITLSILIATLFISLLLTENVSPGAFKKNYKCLYECCVSFFVIFPLGYWYARRGDNRFLVHLIDALTSVYLIILLLGFFTIYTQSDIPFLTDRYMVNHEGRVFFATHPNDSAMICSALMMAGIYRILIGSRKAKVLYILAEVILLVALILTDSRASLLAAVVGFSGIVILAVWKRYGQNKSPWKVALIAVGAAAISILAFWSIRHLGSILGSSEFQPRKLFGDKLGAGSGRLDIWWNIVSYILPNRRDILLHGCGNSAIWGVLAEMAGTVDKLGYEINTHNQFLEIAVAYGVPSLIIFLGWLIMVARCAWGTGTASFNAVSLAERILPLLLLMLIISNMFETALLFYQHVAGSVFFLAAGHVCGHFHRMKEIKPLN